MAKMVENIIRGENRRKPHRRQCSRWSKKMQRQNLTLALNVQDDHSEEQPHAPTTDAEAVTLLQAQEYTSEHEAKGPQVLGICPQ